LDIKAAKAHGLSLRLEVRGSRPGPAMAENRIQPTARGHSSAFEPHRERNSGRLFLEVVSLRKILEAGEDDGIGVTTAPLDRKAWEPDTLGRVPQRNRCPERAPMPEHSHHPGTLFRNATTRRGNRSRA
jgi:hypothetical protein